MGTYTTTELVEAELRSSTSFSSSTIPSLDNVNTWIAEASRRVDIISNSIFSVNTVSSQLFDWAGNSTILNLPISNLITIDKLEYNTNGPGVAPSWTTMTEGIDKDYIVYPDSAEVEFVKGVNSNLGIYPIYGKQKLRVSYTYGYSSVPLEVQSLTTLLVAKRVIHTLASYQANTKMGEITVGPVRVADPSGFSINYMKFLDDEIKTLSDDIAIRYKTFKLPNRVYDGVSGYGIY